jgi:hypothetical protein
MRLLRASALAASALSLHYPDARANSARPTPIMQSDPYADLTAEASQRFAVPASWLRAVMQVESGGDAKAVSPKGAMGLMQLMPDTWFMLRLRYHLGNDPFDPHDNILGGAAYLRELFDRFGASGFLAAYNAGPKRFGDYLAGLRPLAGETRRYVSTLARMLPDLQIGSDAAATSTATGWQTASLFAVAPTTSSSADNASSGSASVNTPASPHFAMAPQSNGLFVPVQMADPR